MPPDSQITLVSNSAEGVLYPFCIPLSMEYFNFPTWMDNVERHEFRRRGIIVLCREFDTGKTRG